jgi:hypothetical protein
MRIDLYTWSWNDAEMLAFLFRHYDRLVQRYVIYDDGSTDQTLDVLHANPKVEVRRTRFEDASNSFILAIMPTIESCWKESRGQADWVIVTEIDEHLHHPNMAAYLKACQQQGVTIVPALGYQMISPEFPQAGEWLCQTRTMGAPWVQMSKVNVFDPNAIETINYTYGRHQAVPTGRVAAPDRDEVMLLHYKYMGFERTLSRHAECQARLQKADLERKFAYRWSFSREQLRADWDTFAGQAVDISNPDLRPGETHPAPRWWEELRLSITHGRRRGL